MSHTFPIGFVPTAASRLTAIHIGAISRPADVHYQYTNGSIVGAQRRVGGADQMAMRLLSSVFIAAWVASAALCIS